MDVYDKKKRSEIMAKIRSKNTRPEVMLRKALFAKGFRYRINYKKLPGSPDIVLPKYKTVIFVNGCFWHGHKGCKYATIPKTNTKYWVNKIEFNKARDKINAIDCARLGWKVITVWECQILKKNILRSIMNIIASAH
jgi:DNA mismatch endonuclease, patch repair protein